MTADATDLNADSNIRSRSESRGPGPNIHFAVSRSTRFTGRVQRLAKAAHPLNMAATMTCGMHSDLPVTVLCASQVDLRLAAPANPEHGEMVTVSIPCRSGGDDVRVTGIVHWKEMRGADHEIGIYLHPGLPARLKYLCPEVRRSSERYRCRIPGQINWGKAEPDCSATVVNYSYEGLAVKSAVSGRVDDVFSFRWSNSHGPQSINGVALWQIEQNGGFLIGCQLEQGAGYQMAGLTPQSILPGG